jgi:hypothetical protein
MEKVFFKKEGNLHCLKELLFEENFCIMEKLSIEFNIVVIEI